MREPKVGEIWIAGGLSSAVEYGKSYEVLSINEPSDSIFVRISGREEEWGLHEVIMDDHPSETDMVKLINSKYE